MLNFVEERLNKGTTPFDDPLHKTKSKTFISVSGRKKVNNIIKNNIISIDAD